MRSLDRWDALWAAGIAAATVAAYFVFRTPEPARTGLDLIGLVCSGGPERAQAVERHVADPLELSFPHDVAVSGEQRYSRAELAAELRRLDALLPGCAFTLEDWMIRPASRGSAWLEGTLELSDSQPFDLHGQRRSLRALFREVGGEQRLERVLLGPAERRLPEARP